jgi:hypothetical protein
MTLRHTSSIHLALPSIKIPRFASHFEIMSIVYCDIYPLTNSLHQFHRLQDIQKCQDFATSAMKSSALHQSWLNI